MQTRRSDRQSRTSTQSTATIANLSPIARPTPISILGDSHVFALSDRVYRAPWGELFAFRSLYCPGLRTREFMRADGVLDDRVRLALQVGRVLMFNGAAMEAAHHAASPHWREITRLDDRLGVEPAVAVSSASIDVIEVANGIAETDVALPQPILDDPRTPDVCRTTAPGALAADEAQRRFAAPLEPLRAGLRILRAHGLSRLAVLGLPPISLDDGLCDAGYVSAGFSLVRRASRLAFRYKTMLLMNAALERLCGEEGVPFIDRWTALTTNGLVRPGVLRDFVHVSEKAAGHLAAQLIDVLGAPPAPQPADDPDDPAERTARSYFALFGGRKLEDAALASLHALAAVGPGVRVLDIGCGRGELARAAASAGADVTVVDPSADAIAVARETVGDLPVRFVCGAASAFRDAGRFDVAIASSELEATADNARLRLFENVAAMLRPSGSFVIRARAERDEDRAAALRWELAGPFEYVLAWAGTRDDPRGALARRLTAAELRESTDAFAIASHEPIDIGRVLERVTMNAVEASVALSLLRSPRQVGAGEAFVAHVTLHNGGAETLRSFEPNPVRLAYAWLDADGVATDAGRARIEPPAEPGATREYALAVVAPLQRGSRGLRVTVVQETVQWFDAAAEAIVDVI